MPKKKDTASAPKKPKETPKEPVQDTVQDTEEKDELNYTKECIMLALQLSYDGRLKTLEMIREHNPKDVHEGSDGSFIDLDCLSPAQLKTLYLHMKSQIN